MCQQCDILGVAPSMTRQEAFEQIYRVYRGDIPNTIVDFIRADINTMVFTATDNGFVLTAGVVDGDKAELTLSLVMAVQDGRLVLVESECKGI